MIHVGDLAGQRREVRDLSVALHVRRGHRAGRGRLAVRGGGGRTEDGGDAEVPDGVSDSAHVDWTEAAGGWRRAGAR